MVSISNAIPSTLTPPPSLRVTSQDRIPDKGLQVIWEGVALLARAGHCFFRATTLRLWISFPKRGPKIETTAPDLRESAQNSRYTFGTIEKEKEWPLRSLKRHQEKHLEFCSFQFGTRGSEVQILSPQPSISRSSIQLAPAALSLTAEPLGAEFARGAAKFRK